MSDERAGLFEVVAIEVSRIFDNLCAALKSGKDVLQMFAELGAQFSPALATDATFLNAVRTAATPLDAQPTAIKELVEAIEAENFVTALKKLADLTKAITDGMTGLKGLGDGLVEASGRGVTGFSASEIVTFVGSDLPDRLLDWSAVSHLETTVPELTVVLDLMGIVDRSEEQVGSTDPRLPQFTRRRLHLENLPKFLQSPLGLLRSKYGFGDASFDGVALLSKLASALSYAGLPGYYDASATPGKLVLLFGDVAVKSDVTPPALALTLLLDFDGEVHGTVGEDVAVDLIAHVLTPPGGTLVISPDLNVSLTGPTTASVSGELRTRWTFAQSDPSKRIIVIGRTNESRLELSQFTAEAGVTLTWDGTSAKGAFSCGAGLKGLHLVIKAAEGDGFLGSFLPGSGLDSTFDIGCKVGPSGVTFDGSAALSLNLPVHLALGPVTVNEVIIGIGIDDGKLPISLGASLDLSLGPITAVIDNIGVRADLTFPGDRSGNLGPVNADLGFKWPTGIGVSVNTAGVSGGGFLYIDEDKGRYAGALELSLFSIAVKAIGLIDSKLPDGSPGYSFIIIISAEFMPIQLGYGFTLVGVGGILGINRTIDAESLGNAVRSGSLDNLLFPTDPVRNAPQIINDLSTVFPAAPNHYLFGPMAKLGWGTPTLITGALGIIIELPGPRLALVGVVRTALPSADFALVRLLMLVSGMLDFPNKSFSLDASLVDSYVGSFSVSGDMAFRLRFGSNANFVFSIGGFNPSYKAPAGVPSLQRASISLGMNGNPRLTAYGYLALTPNTAQIGAGIDLYASGCGITVRGHLGFDAMFVFSPFSFTASFSAGVSVSFCGVGFGMSLGGTLSGPSPWHLDGSLCVSILFFDACLHVDVTFGESHRAELPPVDPWVGPDPFDPERPVIGLQTAVEDAQNWAGSLPPGSERVVSLTAPASAVENRIDPVGLATLRQKAVPLNRKITKFGEYRPVNHDTFTISSVDVGSETGVKFDTVSGPFVPAHFKEMSAAERLSSPPTEDMVAGLTIGPKTIKNGDAQEKNVEYVTKILDVNRQPVGSPVNYRITQRHLVAMLGRSAAGLGGVRRSGPQRYVDPNAPVKVSMSSAGYVVADACTLAKNDALTGPNPVSYMEASIAIEDYLVDHPEQRGRFVVVPTYDLAA